MPVYRMRDIDEVAEWVLEGWNNGRYDAVLLTSPVVAQSFLNLLPRNEQVAVFAWDDDSAMVLRDGGVEPVMVAPSKDNQGVLAVAKKLKEITGK